MREKTIYISFKYADRDADIALAAQYYLPKRLLETGYSRYVKHQTGNKLPLPPPSQEPFPTYANIRVMEGDDCGLYDFFCTIAEHHRAHVARLLMRNALEALDFRHLTGETAPAKRPDAPKRRRPHASAPVLESGPVAAGPPSPQAEAPAKPETHEPKGASRDAAGDNAKGRTEAATAQDDARIPGHRSTPPPKQAPALRAEDDDIFSLI